MALHNSPVAIPYRLRLKARKAGLEPGQFLTETLAKHRTYGEAAEELEISPETLRRWRCLVGIGGANQPAIHV